MRSSHVVLAVGAAALILPGLASAQSPTPPQRKAGWWEMTMGMTAPMPMNQTMHLCTDAETEAATSAFAANQQPGAQCSQGPVTATPGGGWSFSSTCDMGGMTMTTTGTASGDFASNYRVESTTRMSPAPMPQMAESRMTMTARWLGACPAGREPGDMVMGNGMVVNIKPR